jgi:hypothetical protein
MPVLLLVTWISFGQPPSSYQVEFAASAACEAARQQILSDAERIAHNGTFGVQRLPGGGIANGGPPPSVSAICVERETSKLEEPRAPHANISNEDLAAELKRRGLMK